MNGTPAGKVLTEDEKKSLLEQNVIQYAQMDRDAGSMVKQLLWELQAKGRNTYIKLRDVAPGGSVVFYEMVQGSTQLVKDVAETLGFTSYDDHRLEV
ncbi:MAG: hypothetical protein WBW16_02035 [Bacteroidota bacterium]